MRAVEIIIKKREKQELSREEIEFFIEGFTRGEIPDYQASAWAMAVLLNGMSPRETADLTLAMAHSGDMLDLTGIVDIVVDKHSTGGVGDKTSLVVLPLVAACGLPCGKMSGRGLGFSGGTLDKLESIPGYRVDLSIEEFKRQLKEIGIVLTGQSLELAPADGKLYALRDVTGTVPAMPLIVSSIMSKKIAAGAQAIVLDVKVGLGAFVQTLEEARTLASQMVAIGEQAGRRVVTLLSDMNQPLGEAVGNSLEVKEALATLAGGGPDDFREHCLVVAEHMLILGKCADGPAKARTMALEAIRSGMAKDKFRSLVVAQGGDAEYVDDPGRYPSAQFIQAVHSPRNGHISRVNARVIGEASVVLGAGRTRKGDPIDHSVGLTIHRKVGDVVEKGQPLFTVHANDKNLAKAVEQTVMSAFEWSEDPVAPLPLFYE